MRCAPSSEVVLPLAFLVLLSSCASTGRLAEFDFRGRPLAVVATATPPPSVLTGFHRPQEGEGWLGAIFRWGSEMAVDAQAERAAGRLAEVAQDMDLAGHMGDRVLERGTAILRARPVTSVQDADFELEVRVREYGIRADSWDGRADYFIKARVLLLQGRTGERIWKGDVDARDPITSVAWGGTVGNLVTAQALGRLSEPDMKAALKAMAFYAGERIAEKLREGMERVRR